MWLGNKRERGTQLGLNVTFQTVSSESASSFASHRENVTWVNISVKWQVAPQLRLIFRVAAIITLSRCGPRFAAGSLQQWGWEQRPTSLLWIEIKWLSTGQWQPSELGHLETKVLSQYVHTFPESTHMLCRCKSHGDHFWYITLACNPKI